MDARVGPLRLLRRVRVRVGRALAAVRRKNSLRATRKIWKIEWGNYRQPTLWCRIYGLFPQVNCEINGSFSRPDWKYGFLKQYHDTIKMKDFAVFYSDFNKSRIIRLRIRNVRHTVGDLFCITFFSGTLFSQFLLLRKSKNGPSRILEWIWLQNRCAGNSLRPYYISLWYLIKISL